MFHVVSNREGLLLNCIFYGTRKENLIAKEQYLCYGDSFEIGQDCKYIKGVGWFLLIIVNGREEMFVQLESIEKALSDRAVVTIVELQIEVSLLKFKLDHVLKKRMEQEFYEVAAKYTGIKQLNELTLVKMGNSAL
ncbi:hypothetical protein IM538_19555 [Cytobacillus suaedae]|nr:hypothetical protein IM538_19555 [Cytobacillus suaedae]